MWSGPKVGSLCVLLLWYLPVLTDRRPRSSANRTMRKMMLQEISIVPVDSTRKYKNYTPTTSLARRWQISS